MENRKTIVNENVSTTRYNEHIYINANKQTMKLTTEQAYDVYSSISKLVEHDVRELTLDRIYKLVLEYFLKKDNVRRTVRNMKRDVNYYNLDMLVKGKTRKRDIVTVRHTFMYAARKNTANSLKDIAYFVGGRDHSTCINALKTMDNLIQYDKQGKTIAKELNL